MAAVRYGRGACGPWWVLHASCAVCLVLLSLRRCTTWACGSAAIAALLFMRLLSCRAPEVLGICPTTATAY